MQNAKLDRNQLEEAQWFKLVNALDFGSRGPGFRTWPGQCSVFLNKTLHSHRASVKYTLNLEPHSVVCPTPSW